MSEPYGIEMFYWRDNELKEADWMPKIELKAKGSPYFTCVLAYALQSREVDHLWLNSKDFKATGPDDVAREMDAVHAVAEESGCDVVGAVVHVITPEVTR